MHVNPFALEQYQAEYEDHVEINLSESGVRSRSLGELRAVDVPDVANVSLGYPIAKGSPELLEHVSAWYPGAMSSNVVPTNGGCEANFLALWSLLDPGDEVAMMVPNFLQPLGVAETFGKVLPFSLARGEARWELDTGSLREAVSPSTKIVWVCNPNNPTGSVLMESEMDAVVAAADEVGAWIVSDEIYRGAELGRDDTPTFFGRYDKVLVTASLSKAFGLAGLRLGWVVGPPSQVADIRRHRDYTSSMVGHLSDVIGAHVLTPQIRKRVLAENRALLRANLRSLEDWAVEHADTVALASPAAGAIAFVELRHLNSDVEFCDHVRRLASVLLIPGTYMAAPVPGVRIGFGYSAEKTERGLARVGDVIAARGL
jgi:aspartate/methionine/tyrosine aminotransferase